MITRTLPRNAPWFEKPGFDPPHCHTLASLPVKPTFILQHICTFQAQFLPQRLSSASPLHNHRKPSTAVLCHAKTPAPTLNRTKFHPRLAHALTPAFAKTLCQKPNLPRHGRFADKAFISRSTWNVPACLAAWERLAVQPVLSLTSLRGAHSLRTLPNSLAPTRLPLLALNIAKRAAALSLQTNPNSSVSGLRAKRA